MLATSKRIGLANAQVALRVALGHCELGHGEKRTLTWIRPPLPSSMVYSDLFREPRHLARVGIKRTRVLLHDTVLPYFEVLAGRIRPPLLELAMLVIQSAS